MLPPSFAPTARHMRALLLAAGLPCVIAAAGCSVFRAEAPRHVILITVDTCRADALQPWSAPAGRLAASDLLAREGTAFTQAYSSSPMTLPSHATLFTGRQPDEHGAWNNGSFVLPPSEVTLAEVLKERGYRTGAVAASFIANRSSGLDQGFDDYEDVTLQNSHQQRMPLERKAPDVIRDALAWLGEAPGDKRPVFLWVHLYDPHAPYELPEGSPPAGSKLEAYEDEVASADHAVNDLLDGLRTAGLLDSSLVVLTSDHGEALGSHGESTHGYFIHDEVLHVPLFVRAPGLVPAGRRVEQPVGLVDLAPTILSLVGAPRPNGMTGRDLSAAFRGESELSPAPLYAASLVPWLQVGACPQRSLRESGWKLIDGPKPELYDLAADPSELRNLAREPAQAERVASLTAALRAQRDSFRPGSDGRKGMSAEEQEKLRSLMYLAGPKDRTAGSEAECEKDAKDLFLLFEMQVEQTKARLRGHVADAVGILRNMLVESPGLHAARFALADELQAAGFRDEAVQELETLARLASEDSPEHVGLAFVALAELADASGASAQTEGLLRSAIEADAANALAWRHLARVLEREAGRGQEAREAWQRVHVLDPADEEARAFAGTAP